MAIVVAIDAGTTGVRTVAYNDLGQPVTSSYAEFPQYFPHPGWVEHDADEIWNAALHTLKEVASKLNETPRAIGITNQRETVLGWNRRNGKPYGRAIVWQDRRTAEQCATLEAQGHLPLIRERTGLVLDPYFSATKMRWMLETGAVPASDDLAFGTIDSWLIWKLTGGKHHVTDVTNASRTMLFGLASLDWEDELLELFGMSRSWLPKVVASSGVVAETANTSAFGAGIPISGIAGDQQASLFGLGCFSKGMTKNTYGTGSFALANAGLEPPVVSPGLLSTLAWGLSDDNGKIVPTYAVEGSVFVSGAAVQWLRDELGIINTAPDFEPLALSVPDSAGVVFVPAFTGLGSPWWDPSARGAVFGLTRGATAAHLARATLDAIAYSTKDVLDTMTGQSAIPISELRVDGGASAMATLVQLQADLSGVTTLRSAQLETTSLGAAYLAGLAVGVWDSLEQLSAVWKADLVCEPNPENDEVHLAYQIWLRAVCRSRDWVES